MPLSGLLSVSSGGWPSIFYVFGAIGTVWCIAFLIFNYEDPNSDPRISPEEKSYIQQTLGSVGGVSVNFYRKKIVFHFNKIVFLKRF